MNKLKKQISQLRSTTPKHIQWLLLIAAFVVVLILLTLLIGGKKSESVEIIQDDTPASLIFNPSAEPIDWSDTTVGDTRTENIEITATVPVKILSVKPTKEINGLKIQQTCINVQQIDSDVSCTMALTYAPTVAMENTQISVNFEWHDASQPDKMKKQTPLVIDLGAVAPVAPKPVIDMPKPEPVQDVAELQPKITPKDVSPVQQEIKQEIQDIAPDVSLLNKPEPVKKTPSDDYVAPSESCSDFAFPGYNMSGVQAGWIRPENGAYYFHPFSDKDCNSPTGTYNPDNGIITDIKNSGKKIGTDAEHIGYNTIQNGTLPQLSNPATREKPEPDWDSYAAFSKPVDEKFTLKQPKTTVKVGTTGKAYFSSDPYDRTFVLRQYKPIPATIVSEVRADPSLYQNGQKHSLPVRATVDRNVYSDDGRTIIIPTGTLMLGYVTGDIPGPYKSIGRMNISWYQFVLPNGVEFNFKGNPDEDPFSADSQGRMGVPGYGSTDYLEQIVMPMLTAIVPAAVNLIAPISDTFINQIDLDNNTVVQSGTVRSSELAKNEIITAWNQVAQKLIVDALDNTVPPFSIAAGTRITVYSPEDLVVTCGDDDTKKCSFNILSENTQMIANERDSRPDWQHIGTVDYSDGSWIGQVRSFNWSQYCKDGKVDNDKIADIQAAGLSYANVLFYCQTNQYQAINNARQDAIFQSQQNAFQNNYGATQTGTGVWGGSGSGSLTGISGSNEYNTGVLGLVADENGVLSVPTPVEEETPTTGVITCEDGNLPDQNGCCTGEIYTDMGEQGFNCCPETGGDCFPPIL